MTATLLATLLTATAAAVAARTPARQEPPPPPAPLPPAAGQARQLPSAQGRLVGSTYTNDFFGFTISLNPTWAAIDYATRRQINEAGRAALQEGIPQRTKEMMDATTARVDNLFSVSKYDVNKPGPEFNALLMCLAERIPTAVVKTEKDYVTIALRTINQTAAKAELTAPLRTEMLGGVAFTVADMKLTVGPRMLAQRYYVRLSKGYALALVYSYVDEEDLQAVKEMVKTIRFK
ncbi:MAG: hypothetical protein JOZ96_11860 [Acidobacteria bacterium]|nr:hypothetical protein [Acidobacteriota bacterium]